MKQQRCDCLACVGKTIKFSRKRLVEDMREMVSVSLISQAYADESIADFDKYHAPKIEVACGPLQPPEGVRQEK